MLNESPKAREARIARSNTDVGTTIATHINRYLTYNSPKVQFFFQQIYGLIVHCKIRTKMLLFCCVWGKGKTGDLSTYTRVSWNLQS